MSTRRATLFRELSIFLWMVKLWDFARRKQVVSLLFHLRTDPQIRNMCDQVTFGKTKLGLSYAKLRTSFAEIGLAKFQITGWVEEA